MGGAGHMLHAIKSLKANRALKKGRKVKRLKDVLDDSTVKTTLEFKEVEPQELERIKTNIRREARKRRRKEIILYMIVSLTILAFLLFAY
nr:hypothetical protein [Allomuricauda sp.]